MEILLLLGIYFVELLCYQAVMRMLFQVNVTTKKWMILGGVLPLVIGVMPVNDTAEKNLLVTVSVIAIMFLSTEGTVIEKSIKLFLELLVLACIEDIFAYPCGKLFIFVRIDYRKYVSCLVSKFLTFISIVILYNVKEKVNKHNKTHISSSIYLLIGFIIGLMLLCLSIMNQVITYFPNNRYIILCNIFNVAILSSIFLLVVFIIYIKNTHERMEQLLKTERLLKESQVNYYKQNLRKEVETRKYRHDMINHLVYVQEILSQNRIEEVQKYLANMMGGFKRIQSLYYVTGNEMVDTIMNYFFSMLPESIEIKIKGRCLVTIDIEESDICTIFSNIFQNAAEEIVENNILNAKIIVVIHKGKQFVEYKIRNSILTRINEKNIDKNGLPKSHKLDKQNHGIGMINIKNTVERNHGKFEWNQYDGYFNVIVILPIK